jgi:DNA-directed RNA polymerase specialized sigma24 family protein
MRMLPSNQAEVIALKLADFTLNEAAQILGVTEGTVKQLPSFPNYFVELSAQVSATHV